MRELLAEHHDADAILLRRVNDQGFRRQAERRRTKLLQFLGSARSDDDQERSGRATDFIVKLSKFLRSSMPTPSLERQNELDRPPALRGSLTVPGP